ncbi:MAG: hypothetical protein N2510_02305 [Ignavibacteria bacterium]|nr:hypothetical protein [Ignavibacteria bacterium]
MEKIKTIAALTLFVFLIISCSKIQTLIEGDKLYFCERYDGREIGKSDKFTTGKLTVMVKLSKPIGVTEVDINITDKSTGKPVDTYPYTVNSTWDYIHFDNVLFREPGKYRVSCLKKDGTVIVSGDVEIVSK